MFYCFCVLFPKLFFSFSKLWREARTRTNTFTQRYTYFFVRRICQLASWKAEEVIRLSCRLVSVYSLLKTGLKLNASLFVQQLCQVPMSQCRRDQLAVPSWRKREGLWQRRWETMKTSQKMAVWVSVGSSQRGGGCLEPAFENKGEEWAKVPFFNATWWCVPAILLLTDTWFRHVNAQQHSC